MSGPVDAASLAARTSAASTTFKPTSSRCACANTDKIASSGVAYGASAEVITGTALGPSTSGWIIEPHGPSWIGALLLSATAASGVERATLYEEVVLSCLTEAMRRELEEKMASGAYEYKSELIRKNIEVGRAQGRAEGEAKGKAVAVLAVLAVLEARGLPIADEVRARISSCSDLATLERWVRRAVLVSAAGEIFDEAQ